MSYRGYPGKLKGDFAALKRAGVPGAGDYRGPNTTFTFDGARVVQCACACGMMNSLPLANAGAYQRGYCRRCKRVTNQERVR